MMNLVLKKDKKRESFWVLSISLFLFLISTRNYLTQPGYIYLAEQFEVYSPESLWAVVYPIWSENLQIVNFVDSSKIYLYGPILFISSLFRSYKFLQILLLFVPIPLAFVSMYILARDLLSSESSTGYENNNLFIAALIAALVYTINPWFTTEPRNIILRYEYSLTPFLLYLFIKIISEKKLNMKFPILFAIIFAVVSGYRYFALFTFLTLVVSLLYITLYKFILKKDIYTKYFIIKFVITYFLASILLLGKFVAQVIYYCSESVIYTKELTTALIRRVSMLVLFTTQTTSGAAKAFNMTYFVENYYFLFIYIFALSFVCVIYRFRSSLKNSYYVLILIFIIVIFSALSVDNVISNNILSKFPPLSRLFRSAKWNTMPIVLAVAIMVADTVYILLTKKTTKVFRALVVVLLIFVLAISSYPFFTGDMSGYWRPARLPKEYAVVRNMLLENNQSVLWVPNFGDMKAIWVNSTTPYEVGAPMGIFDIRSSDARSWWYNPYFYFFDYYLPMDDCRVSPLKNFNNYDLLSKIYSSIGVKYLALHYDIRWIDKYKIRGLSNEYIRKIGDEITSSDFYKDVYKGNFIELIEINRNVNNLYVSNHVVDISGRLTDLGSISALPNDKLPAIIFLDYWNFDYSNSFNDADFLIVRDPISIGLPSIVHDNRTIILCPASFTLQGNPMEGWAKSQVDSYSLQYYIWMSDVQWNWPFDYGAGLVFTFRQPYLKEDAFSIDGRALDSPSFESTSVFLNVSHQNGAVYGKIISGNWDEWIEAISTPINVKNCSYYKIEFTAKGQDVIDFNAIVRYYDKNGKMLGFDILNEPLTGTFGHENFSSVVYTPAGTDYMKIAFRTWQNREKSSFWEVENLRIYDQSEFVERNMLTMPFKIEKDGSFVVLIRILKCSKGGAVAVWLDGKKVAEINTRDELTGFSWRKIGEFKLSTGNHELSIENIYGLNAVNVVLIVNKDVYEDAMKKAVSLIKSKNIVHIFEAERDFYLKGGSRVRDRESSNGAVFVNITSGEFIEPYEIRVHPSSWVFIPKIPDPTPVCPPLTCRLKLRYAPGGEGNSAISATSDGHVTSIDYEFKNVNATPVIVNWELNGINWSKYDSVSVNVYGDGSNNTLSFWFYDDVTRRKFSIGAVKLDWVGWKKLVLYLRDYNRTTVKYLRAVLQWNGAKEGLGKHRIFIKDIKVEKTRGFKLSRSFTLLKEGKYTIAARGIGEFWVYIDDSFCKFKFGKEYRWRTCIMYLDEGEHNMRVISPRATSKLDLVLVYSSTKSLESLMKRNVSAKVLEYRKISPTKWIAKIRADEPFVLAFTSGYDPFWVAKVDGATYSSIPLYGLINGFYINKTGEYWVEIEYELQKYYDFGLAVSGMAFLLSFAYLVVAWRRSNEDD